MENKLKEIWISLYGETNFDLLDSYISYLKQIKQNHFSLETQDDELWYKKAIIYCLYVDLFADNFENFLGKLDYLANLGVNWLIFFDIQKPI